MATGLARAPGTARRPLHGVAVRPRLHRTRGPVRTRQAAPGARPRPARRGPAPARGPGLAGPPARWHAAAAIAGAPGHAAPGTGRRDVAWGRGGDVAGNGRAMSDPFAARLLAWFDHAGRHDLPWQHPRSPYRVWLSEIMLQQTRVATVIPYFERFVAALPDLPALAAASQEQVLALWSGLGYYARARNLHATAKLCMERHAGELPRGIDELQALPGIGRSTAAAIAAQAWGARHAILDGNVKRVLARYHGVEGWPNLPRVEKA